MLILFVVVCERYFQLLFFSEIIGKDCRIYDYLIEIIIDKYFWRTKTSPSMNMRIQEIEQEQPDVMVTKFSEFLKIV